MANHPFQGSHPIPLWPWGIVGLITVPLAVAALITFGRISEFVVFGDADWYATAIPALFTDGPLYDPSKLGPHEFAFPPYWNQPPSTVPFALILGVPEGRWLWGGICVASVLLGLLVLWPRVGPGGALLMLPVLIVWLPVPSALAWANVNAIVFALLALAWRFPRAAGWSIGFAAALKLVPIIGVAWLLGRRDWRNAAIAVSIFLAATVAVVALKGPETITDFVLLRLNETTPPGVRPRWNPVELFGLPDWIAYLSAAALTVLAVVYASLSLAIIAMLVAVPALHAHYLTWLLVPILGIWLPAFLNWRSDRRADLATV